MVNQSEQETSGNADGTLSDTARATYSNLREDGGSAQETAYDTAESLDESLEEEAEEESSEEAGDLDEMMTKAEFAIIDHPLLAVGAAFAVGWITSRLFR